MKPTYENVLKKLELIENEMKKINLWQAEPLKEEQYDFRAAFALDTMAYSQWLQFIFIPRVHKIINEKGEFPSSSQVGTQGMREFDGINEAQRLVELLNDFDGLFN
jgi:uncharacterized protein YqcC (DUF446 family)